jgi:hypothetical protein
MRDPEFLAEAQKIKLEIDPVSGTHVEDLIADAYNAPEAVVTRARKLIE